MAFDVFKRKGKGAQPEQPGSSHKEAMLERVRATQAQQQTSDFVGPVSPEMLEQIRNQLIQTHTDVVIRAMMDESAKDLLREVIVKRFPVETNGAQPDVVEYVLHKVINSGIVILPRDEKDGEYRYQPAPIEQAIEQSPITSATAVSAAPSTGAIRTPGVPPQQTGGAKVIRGEERGGGVVDDKLVDITAPHRSPENMSVEERAALLKAEHAQLLQSGAAREAERNKGREGFRQPVNGIDVDELSLIRSNQKRLKEWKESGGALIGKTLPNGVKPSAGRPAKEVKISPGVPNPRPQAADVPEETPIAGSKGKASRKPRRRNKAPGVTDVDEIMELRRNIEMEQVEEYDAEGIASRNAQDNEEDQDPADFISDSELSSIREALIQAFPGLLIRGMMEQEARDELELEVRKTYKRQTRQGQDFLVDYIVRETVGTGVIESILENDPSITDIGYDGKKLIIESNDKKYIYSSSQDINDEYIERLVNKFAHANGRDFTEKDPVFDGTFNNIRINAMYGSNTTSGITMALRVVRPKLALTEETFDGFAPHYIFQLLQSMVQAKGNFMLAGETGTGKTELQKLLASFIPFNQRIVLIEDVAETFLKDMFPEKDIYSWITSADVSITTLVKASLRNNPRWIVVSETRGAEAYEMIQAVLSGHSIITTLHAINARAIPTRLVNMAKMGYDFSEEALKNDIRRYFDFGIHIVRDEYKGKTLRYLSELLYFDEGGDRLVFKQDFMDGKFIAQTGEIPEELKRRMRQVGFPYDEFIENRAHIREIHVDEVTESNRTRLDLSIVEGRDMSYDEVRNLVNEVVVDKDLMPTQMKVRAVPVTASSVHAARNVDSPVVQLGGTGSNVRPGIPTPPERPKPKSQPDRPVAEPVRERQQPASTGNRPAQQNAPKQTQQRPSGNAPKQAAEKPSTNGQVNPRPTSQAPVNEPKRAPQGQQRPAQTNKPNQAQQRQAGQPQTSRPKQAPQGQAQQRPAEAPKLADGVIQSKPLGGMPIVNKPQQASRKPVVPTVEQPTPQRPVTQPGKPAKK